MDSEKRTSVAKVHANKGNAAKSTGPKTEEGKAAVKLNALKHGLLSKEVIIREGEGREDEGEFLALIQELQEDILPVGGMERMFVEKIAICAWRLRRALRFESGMLREHLDSLCENYDYEVAWGDKRVNILREYDQLRAVEEETIRGNDRCIKMLRDGLDLSQLHEGKDIGMTAYYRDLITKEYIGDDWIDADLDQDRFLGEEMTLKEMRDFLLKKGWIDDSLRSNFVQQDLDGIRDAKEKLLRLEAFKQAEELRLSRFRLTKALIPQEEAEKLLRYETAIERQLYRALDQLERMQRHRLGDHVPPPIDVEVNSEGA